MVLGGRQGVGLHSLAVDVHHVDAALGVGFQDVAQHGGEGGLAAAGGAADEQAPRGGSAELPPRLSERMRERGQSLLSRELKA